jgi:hypothetical protein
VSELRNGLPSLSLSPLPPSAFGSLIHVQNDPSASPALRPKLSYFSLSFFFCFPNVNYVWHIIRSMYMHSHMRVKLTRRPKMLGAGYDELTSSTSASKNSKEFQKKGGGGGS